MKKIELPQQVVEALLQYGLKTEAGAALLAGYRLGHPVLSASQSDLKLTDIKASIAIDALEPEPEA